mmetsp:Transcript_14877/g.37474  ORF Transcript_14877/g.37474 Transcript_14877/m.37474 type:complete len:204 (+) Transcript_14877:55-666(+)
MKFSTTSFFALCLVGGQQSFVRSKEIALLDLLESIRSRRSYVDYDDFDDYDDYDEYDECVDLTLDMLENHEPQVRKAWNDFVYSNEIVEHIHQSDADMTIKFLKSKDELRKVCNDAKQYFIEASSTITCTTKDEDGTRAENFVGVAICAANIPECKRIDFIMDLIHDFDEADECSYAEIHQLEASISVVTSLAIIGRGINDDR